MIDIHGVLAAARSLSTFLISAERYCGSCIARTARSNSSALT